MDYIQSYPAYRESRLCKFCATLTSILRPYDNGEIPDKRDVTVNKCTWIPTVELMPDVI